MKFLTKIKNVSYLYIEYLKADRLDLNQKKYLIYHYDGHFMGIMSKMLTALGWLDFAEKNGLELIVDICDNDIFDGRKNTWECYYEQPMLKRSVSHEEIMKIVQNGEGLIAPTQTRFHYRFYNAAKPLMKIAPPSIVFPTPRDHKNQPNVQSRFQELYRKYIHFNSEVSEYLQNEYESVLAGSGKILGVLCRGTDYVQRKPEGHPVQPLVSEVLDYAELLQKTNHWDYIYLATDEKRTEEQFTDRFPGKILTNKRQYFDGDYSDSFLCDIKSNRDNDQYYRDLEYLSSMNLLSKCDMFIGGYCGGSQGVLLMNDKPFELVHLFERGDY